MSLNHTLFWQKITEEIKNLWTDNILQIAVFDCSESTCGKIMVVLDEDRIDELVLAQKVFKNIRKKDLDVPYVFTKNYILSSLDSFPLEFLNMKTNYHSLFDREDVLAGLSFDKADMRLEIERELKSKWLLIRMNLIENFHDTKLQLRLIQEAGYNIKMVMKGILFLYDQEIPDKMLDILVSVEKIIGSNFPTLTKAVKIIRGELKLPKNEVDTLTIDFIKEYETLINLIETKL